MKNWGEIGWSSEAIADRRNCSELALSPMNAADRPGQPQHQEHEHRAIRSRARCGETGRM